MVDSIIYYDYLNQAWVINGLYVPCGHVDGLWRGNECGCYGTLHEGETPNGSNCLEMAIPAIEARGAEDSRTVRSVQLPGLGARMRQVRVAAGLSKESVAEAVDEDWKTVLKWEQDKRAIRWSLLSRYAIACGVSIGDLFPPFQPAGNTNV